MVEAGSFRKAWETLLQAARDRAHIKLEDLGHQLAQRYSSIFDLGRTEDGYHPAAKVTYELRHLVRAAADEAIYRLQPMLNHGPPTRCVRHEDEEPAITDAPTSAQEGLAEIQARPPIASEWRSGNGTDPNGLDAVAYLPEYVHEP